MVLRGLFKEYKVFDCSKLARLLNFFNLCFRSGFKTVVRSGARSTRPRWRTPRRRPSGTTTSRAATTTTTPTTTTMTRIWAACTISRRSADPGDDPRRFPDSALPKNPSRLLFFVDCQRPAESFGATVGLEYQPLAASVVGVLISGTSV